MTVCDFCMKSTNVKELVVIRDAGYIVHTVWIDCEDLFAIHPNYANKEVIGDEWGYLSIVTEHGDTLSVPCHYINIIS